jgi:predicted transposase/invertase (TIGR01784 family)
MDQEDPSIHQPHDKLFTATFSQPEHTAAFLRAKLPPEVSAAIDWPQLTLESGKFIDSHYTLSQTDLLFSVPINGVLAKIYILFEHQSSKDPFLLFRLLRYMLRIWESLIAAYYATHGTYSGLKIPVILPVVLSQNGEVWHLPTRLSELLDLPEQIRPYLTPFIPDFQYHHLQLAQMPFESIPGTHAGILVLRTLKAERIDQLLSDLVWDETLLNKTSVEILQLVLAYILDADVDKQAFESKIKTIQTQSTRSTAMTLAQQYFQEGRQEGIQQGLHDGELAITLRQLRRKFPAIATQAEPIIRKLDEEHLLSFSEALLFLPSNEACLEWLQQQA